MDLFIILSMKYIFYVSCKNETFLLANKYFKLILKEHTTIYNNHFIFISYIAILYYL